MQDARLLRQRGHRDRVLEQPTEVGVMPGAGAGRPAELGPKGAVAQERVEQSPQVAVVDLAPEVLQEAVELVEVPVGRRQELRRIDIRRVHLPYLLQLRLELV